IAWIPGRITNPANGSQGRSEWAQRRRAKERAAWRERARTVLTDAINRSGWKLDSHAPKIVALTAHVWSLFDPDGLANALKPIVDGLRDTRPAILHDDGPEERSGHRILRRQVLDRKRRGVIVVVEPA